jgi:poly(A) polymerase
MTDLKLLEEKDGAKIYEFNISRPLTDRETKAVEILDTLKRRGYETYFAGGAVRDELLGITSHDIDIVTAAKPEEVEKLFAKSYDRGKLFGVVAVMEGDNEFEVATFRADLGIDDHRHPVKVEFTSAKEDAKRRDFTINALFFDPKANRIIDYAGGVEDLKEGKLRFVGEPKNRIEEDFLRMLRAARFASRFKLSIDSSTEEAIKLFSGQIIHVSQERIRDEVSKILININRVKGLDLLDKWGLLKEVLPELESLKGVTQPPEFHSEGDVWQHTMLALEKLPDFCSEELAWTVLLHDVAKPETQGFRDHPKSKITFFEHDVLSARKAEEILKRLKFSNEFIDKVSWSIAQHMRIMHAFGQMSDRKKQKLFMDPNIDLLLEHTRADLSASVRQDGKIDLSMYENALKLRAEIAKKVSRQEKEQVKNFTLITGQDIMDILKLAPGPKVGEIKGKIEQAYLDGKISTREQALKMIKEHK